MRFFGRDLLQELGIQLNVQNNPAYETNESYAEIGASLQQ